MKRITAIITLILLLTVFASSAVFASGLTVTDITPKDGETGKQPQNMAVKVTFSQDMMWSTPTSLSRSCTAPKSIRIAGWSQSYLVSIRIYCGDPPGPFTEGGTWMRNDHHLQDPDTATDNKVSMGSWLS